MSLNLVGDAGEVGCVASNSVPVEVESSFVPTSKCLSLVQEEIYPDMKDRE